MKSCIIPFEKSKKQGKNPPVLSEDATLTTHGLERKMLDFDQNIVLIEVTNVMNFLNDWWVTFLRENLNKNEVISNEDVKNRFEWRDMSLDDMGKFLGILRSKECKEKYSKTETIAISNAFQANSVAQFFCYKTLTKAGFGITNKITGTKFHFDLFEKVIEILQASGENLVPTGIPHAIIKFPSGDGCLKPHVDFRNRSFLDLNNELYKCKTMPEWLNIHGKQILLHVHCGTGSTLGLENLTIDVFRLLMTMLNPKNPFPSLEGLMTSEIWRKLVDGPLFKFD